MMLKSKGVPILFSLFSETMFARWRKQIDQGRQNMESAASQGGPE